MISVRRIPILSDRADVDLPGEIRCAALPVGDRTGDGEAGAVWHIRNIGEKSLHDRRQSVEILAREPSCLNHLHGIGVNVENREA